MNQLKNGDCFICAYAECENISWKQSKRRLSKHLSSRKKLGILNESIKNKGVKGYQLVSDGEFNSLHEVFNFSKGILMIHWGVGNSGHALHWDGKQLIDHDESGRFHKEKDLKLLRKHESVCLVMYKKDTGFIDKMISKFHYFKYLLLTK